MKKSILLLIAMFFPLSTCLAATECDVWLGTWDVLMQDGSARVWVIDNIVTGTSGNIICQAQGTSTPAAGGEATAFQIIRVTFYPEFIYTEAPKLGESMERHELLLNDTGDAFEGGTVFADYGIASGTKRVSGPRCGGVEPSYASAGDTMLELTIRGTETSFDNQTTAVAFLCSEVQLVSAQVVSATEIRAVIDIADNATDTQCTVEVATGDETIICSLNVRGIGDPERVLWIFEAGNIVSSSPAVSGGFVYVGSVDGSVYCLDEQTGAQVWKFVTGGSVFSCPVIVDNYLYVGSNDKKVYCLNAQTGSKVWEFATGGDVQSSPALVDDRVYIGSFDNKVYCLDAATGAKLWEFETGDDVYSTPAVADGRVYVGGVDYRLYCLNAQTGASEWDYATGGDIPPSPAVADGYVYVGSKDKNFYCLDAVTGATVWSFATGDICFNSPAVSRGYVYFGSLDDKVYCLDAATGAKAWEFLTDGDVQSSPALTKDYLYIGSSDGNVYCLDAEMGTRMWSYKTGGSVYSSPAVVGARVYVGSFDKRLYCLAAPADEEQDWPMFRFNLARTGSRDQAACVAAAVLGPASPELGTLRKFRDQVLAKSAAGRRLISLYYAHADDMVAACSAHPALRAALAGALRAALPMAAALTDGTSAE
jgi:outer membrane protein assembly factor BamB